MSSKDASGCPNYMDVNGYEIHVEERLSPVSYNKRVTEFAVSSRSFQWLPWLGYTVLLVLIALFAQFHTVQPGLQILAIMILIAMLWYRSRRKVISETLLLVAGLGIQRTTTFCTGHQHTSFIPWGDIEDVIIVETITMQRVLYFMAVLVKAKGTITGQQLIPLFQNTWPRLECLEHIYRACQEVLQPTP